MCLVGVGVGTGGEVDVGPNFLDNPSWSPRGAATLSGSSKTSLSYKSHVREYLDCPLIQLIEQKLAHFFAV